MEIKVQKDSFKNSISSSKKAISKVTIQEERSHLLFVVRGSSMEVTGTNSDFKARSIVPVDNLSKENFSFTADPKTLEKLISKIDIGEIRLSFNPLDLVARVYTTDSDKSFSSFQSFPADKMLTFSIPDSGVKKYVINKAVLLFTLEYAESFLAALKDDQKQFDFVVINKGIVFSSNGSTKLGLIIFRAFEKVENFKIRKNVLPFLRTFIENIEGSDISLIETDRDLGVESIDGSMYYSFLKSNIGTPDIPKEHIKSEGPYTKIDKNKLVKIIDRLMISNPISSTCGVEFNLTGKREEAALCLNLVSTLKVTENFPCSRENDPAGEDIAHVVDYRVLKAILTSFETDKEVRLHINESKKFYKVYSSGEVEGNKYILVGVGAYAKVVRQ